MGLPLSTALSVPVPLASAKRPVPPVIVKMVDASVPVGVPVDAPVVNSLSPFAATSVAVPVKLNVSGPVSVNDVTSTVEVILPRCES